MAALTLHCPDRYRFHTTVQLNNTSLPTRFKLQLPQYIKCEWLHKVQALLLARESTITTEITDTHHYQWPITSLPSKSAGDVLCICYSVRTDSAKQVLCHLLVSLNLKRQLARKAKNAAKKQKGDSDGGKIQSDINRWQWKYWHYYC